MTNIARNKNVQGPLKSEGNDGAFSHKAQSAVDSTGKPFIGEGIEPELGNAAQAVGLNGRLEVGTENGEKYRYTTAAGNLITVVPEGNRLAVRHDGEEGHELYFNTDIALYAPPEEIAETLRDAAAERALVDAADQSGILFEGEVFEFRDVTQSADGHDVELHLKDYDNDTEHYISYDYRNRSATISIEGVYNDEHRDDPENIQVAMEDIWGEKSVHQAFADLREGYLLSPDADPRHTGARQAAEAAIGEGSEHYAEDA